MDSALDRLPVAFLAFDDDGIITAANQTAGVNFGYEVAELVGTRFEKILTVPSRIFYQTHLFPLLKMHGSVSEIYLNGLRKDGQELPLLLNAVRVVDGDKAENECVLMYMGRRSEYEDEIIRARKAADLAVTEKKSALQAVEQLNNTLDERVRERTAELEELNLELQSFNYSLAHDLRGPIRAVIATSAILLEEIGPSLNADQHELLTEQKSSASKLVKLVNDLLLYSRLSQKPVTRKELNLSEIATRSARDASERYAPVDLEFDIAPGLCASADWSMAEILFESLIDNAAKFSPRGGLVRVGQRKERDSTVYFVEDQGIGFDMEYADRIFRPFERLHRDVAYPGTGIGLAVAARVVVRHQGELWVESTEGKGTTFFFTLGERSDTR